jgi:dTDP-4-dehydrorhamnose reductase
MPDTANTVILGAGGMLGRELSAAANRRGLHPLLANGRCDVDITDTAALRALLADAHPDVVINAAAYTDVDGAERDTTLAMAVNGDGPAILARECARNDVLLVHYSTDYIFNGRSKKPYRVDHPPHPVNRYGESKLAGELAVAASGCRHLLLRTSWLFAPHGKNFVRTILSLAEQRTSIDVVNDQCGRPTHCRDLAEMTLDLIECGAEQSHETLHVTCGGQCTWFEFASEIIAGAELDCVVNPCATCDMPRPARRPAWSVLDITDTIRLIGRPRHWRDALAECVRELRAEHMTATGG